MQETGLIRIVSTNAFDKIEVYKNYYTIFYLHLLYMYMTTYMIMLRFIGIRGLVQLCSIYINFLRFYSLI